MEKKLRHIKAMPHDGEGSFDPRRSKDPGRGWRPRDTELFEFLLEASP